MKVGVRLFSRSFVPLGLLLVGACVSVNERSEDAGRDDVDAGAPSVDSEATTIDSSPLVDARTALDGGAAGDGPPESGWVELSEPTPTCVGATGDGGGPAVTGYEWAQRYGCGPSNYITSTIVDGAGNIIVGANLSGTLDFGTGPRTAEDGVDAVVAKIDATGHAQWAHRFGGTKDQTGPLLALHPTTGDIFVALANMGTADLGLGKLAHLGYVSTVIARLDADGRPRWQMQLGGGTATADAVIPRGLVWSAATNQLVLAGGFIGTVSFGGPSLSETSTRGFVAAFDADGNHGLSTKVAGTTAIESVAVDATGAIAFTGGTLSCFVGRLGATGSPLWSHVYDNCHPMYVATDSVGGILVSGYYSAQSTFGGLGPLPKGTMFARFDASGATTYAKSCGTIAGTVGVVVGPGDAPFLFGNAAVASSAGSCFVARHDSTGALVASRTCGHPLGTPVTGAFSSKGVFVLGGSFYGSNPLAFGDISITRGPDLQPFIASVDAP